MTYRERRERRAERLRGWADKRQRDARATFAAHEVYRGDVAFNTQPGHIPERARVIAREDRAHASLQKAARMDERADNIESQLDHAIYSDDPDAIDRLAERVADLEAERERIKAYNVTARKGTPDRSILNDQERASLDSEARFSPEYFARRHGQMPAYHLANLNGNIKRNRDRLDMLRRRAAPSLIDAINANPEPLNTAIRELVADVVAARELVTVPVGDGLAGYPPPSAFAKVAMIRTGSAPIGYPGSLCLSCPCGHRPATELDGPDVTCACGVTYSFNGWRRQA